MMPLSKVVLIAGLLIAAPALAQEAPIASSTAAETDAQIQQYLDSPAAPLTATTDGYGPADGPPRTDRAPHGEFGVGIGSGGYRSVYASTVVPVGETGSAAIAVSDMRANGRFGPRKQQSLAFALNLGDASAQPPRPEGCREDRLSRREIEPMWVTRMRAGQTLTPSACVRDR